MILSIIIYPKKRTDNLTNKDRSMRKYLIVALLILNLGLQAQDFKNHPNVADIHARKWEYIVERAKLTPQQAEKIEPVFMEYEEALWKSSEQMRDAFKKFRDEKRSKNKPDYEELNKRFIALDIEKAQLQKNYYLKLKKSLNDETIYNYFGAERSFRKELIKDWPGNRRMPGRQ